jgi:hypothetical protein
MPSRAAASLCMQGGCLWKLYLLSISLSFATQGSNACAFFESGVLQLLHALRIAETRPCRLFPNEAFLDEQRENYLYFGNERLSAGRSEERAARRGVVLRVMYKIELQRGRFGIRYEQRSQVPHRPALPSCYVTVEQDHVTLAPYYPY